MVYDSAHGQVVLFGGLDSATLTSLSDTWVWDGVNWTQKFPENAPASRYAHSMAYDSAHGQVVLFGGTHLLANGTSHDTNDTWIWDGDNWTQKSTQTTPPVREAPVMVYDAAHSQVVLFGGLSVDTGSACLSALNDTWVWDGTNWSRKSPQTSPPGRFQSSAAYDSANGQVVVFGGGTAQCIGTSSSLANDTWVWDGANWTQKSPHDNPARRFQQTMIYDSGLGRTVMFGGATNQPTFQGLSDTWLWDGVNWTQNMPSGPSGRYAHAMAYDAGRGEVVLFGGVNPSGGPTNPDFSDTWTFDSAGAQPTTRTIAHIANGAAWRTTVILVNTGTQSASFDLKFWDEHGNALLVDLGADGVTADLQGTIQPGVARFIRTQGAGALAGGWAELTAPPAIDGNSIFGLQSPGHGDSEAAVPLSPGGGKDLFVPFDYSTGYSTGVAFADSGQQDATVSASILDDAGNAILATSIIPVPARGHFANVLATLYPGVVGKRGVAHFTSNTEISGLGIRANGKAFTSIDALSGVNGAAKTIPHIADGASWKTTFLLVSTDTQPAQFVLSFWHDDGTAFAVPLATGSTTTSVSGTILPGELRVIQTTGTAAQLATGWAQLSALTGAIGGTAIFALQSPGQSDSEAAVPFTTASSGKLFMPYDYSPGYSTGIALTNPNGAAAIVTATFTDDGGHNLGSGQIFVAAHGHASAVLGSVLPAIAGTRGTVALTSNVPVFGLGIRANGVAFTSLKVIVQ
jgi:hypothetical protein